MCQLFVVKSKCHCQVFKDFWGVDVPCPDCQGTGEMEIEVEVWHVQFWDATLYRYGKVGHREDGSTYRISASPNMFNSVQAALQDAKCS